jgi:hypothetical protein
MANPVVIYEPHPWRFFRAGGFDQVLLESGQDLYALSTLDQKLWVALSCPVDGVEFDKRTLQFIDSDQDGHIRAPEILAALEWLKPRLKNPEILIKGGGGLPLAEIDDTTAEGALLLASARTILSNIGKPGAELITVEEAGDSEKIFGNTSFNGDGIITAASTDDPLLKGWIVAIIDSLGGEVDRNGETGISCEKLTQFDNAVNAWLDWQEEAESDPAIRLLERSALLTGAEWQGLKGKIDDYFIRCRMAAYDSRAAVILNSSDADLTALASRNLNEAGEEIASLPLASVTAEQTLNLIEGINPAWSLRMAAFSKGVVLPLLGEKGCLTAAEWEDMKQRFATYEAWWERRVETETAKLGMENLLKWREEGAHPRLTALLEEDLSLKEAADAMVDVEKLARLCRDILPLANNFVSFNDFYTGRGKAIFQAGTLYLDGRSCELCVKVADIAKHAVLASLSRVYLVYCDCVRNSGAERMTIAAAFTSGDSDQLLVGRNGVFYDRSGQDWDATVVRIIDHPISIRQAFWAPYKRISRMIGEQLHKLAAARSKQAEEKAAASIMKVGQKDEVKPGVQGQPQQHFDVGKFAGIFAAIGLAVGAIGTAIASVITGFFKLTWWQMPLAILGLMLIVSGPSVVIAWFKLHQRNLGPLLDANGWAVNARAKLNIPFGASLTDMARLPEGTKQLLADPFAEKHSPWKLYLTIIVAIACLLLAWRFGLLGHIKGK